MVKSNLQPFISGGIDDLFNQITVENGAGIIVADLRIMQGETVTLTGIPTNLHVRSCIMHHASCFTVIWVDKHGCLLPFMSAN